MLRTEVHHAPPALLATCIAAFATPAFAVDITENGQGQISFTMPSGNIGCIYTPAGGTDFDYGEIWEFDGFRCTSSTSGLTCKRGGHGFSMSRKAVKAY